MTEPNLEAVLADAMGARSLSRPNACRIAPKSAQNRRLSVPTRNRQLVRLHRDRGPSLGTLYIRGMRTRKPKTWTAVTYSPHDLLQVQILVDGWAREMTIYGLVSSKEPKRVRYVGRTMHPENRFDGHAKAGADRVAAWFKECEDNAAAPWMVQLERCPPNIGGQRELHWIRFYRAIGMADLNTSGCR